MDCVASYLLCIENKLEPSKANISKLIKAAGGSCNETDLDSFISKVGEKSHEEIISIGAAMMVLQSSSSAPAAKTESAGAKAAAPADESSGESDDGMVMDLF
ncbi:hypothetical protein PAEPH01_2066 [Pancytospora epiphaga]|nr:hypothetical protein PAEPH01_2066 [Pancytospora epiphaga]